MKNTFEAPTPVKLAVMLLLLLPLSMSVWMLRLYRYPDNPNAWLVLAVWEVAHLIAGYFLLSRSRSMRWLWAAWVVLKFITGYSVVPQTLAYPEVFAQLCIGAAVYGTTAILLFLPRSNAFFAGGKQPNKSSETNTLTEE